MATVKAGAALFKWIPVFLFRLHRERGVGGTYRKG
jgi:hypothetical protein